jgi:predicted RNase H-like HicB family nuclease
VITLSWQHRPHALQAYENALLRFMIALGYSTSQAPIRIMQISLKFKLPARIRKKGKWYVSSCDFLDVHSQGHTREQAETNLRDALATFLTSCYERGTLEAVLKESGFVPARSRNSLKHSVPKGTTEIVVPLPFSIAPQQARAASA